MPPEARTSFDVAEASPEPRSEVSSGPCSGASLEPRSGARERRIAAIVLPELLCEVARAREAVHSKAQQWPPTGILLLDELGEEREVRPAASLAAVDSEAHRLGVRAGQTVAEACALVAHLSMVEVTLQEVRAALERVADVAFAFGATVSLGMPELSSAAVVWVDLTGAAHLFGGEQAVADELIERVRELGHRAQVAVSGGPHLARAFATWGRMRDGEGGARTCVVPASETFQRVQELPILALPLDAERCDWLSRLGVLDIGQLTALPRKASAARLGSDAGRILQLCAGNDNAPLVPYEPPRRLLEEMHWDEPAEGIEPLLFAVRGLVAKVSARLLGRGEAANRLVLEVLHDRSIARLRGAPPSVELVFELGAPLWRESELERVLRARLERTTLRAPSLGVRLLVPELTEAPARQVDFSRVSGGQLKGSQKLEELPVLLAELAADVGAERVGVLRLVDSHRPEDRSVLMPFGEVRLGLGGRGGGASKRSSSVGSSAGSSKRSGKRGAMQMTLGAASRTSANLSRVNRSSVSHSKTNRGGAMRESKRSGGSDSGASNLGAKRSSPSAADLLNAQAAEVGQWGRLEAATRLLPRPIPFEAPMRVGATCTIGRRFFSIEKVRFVKRLEGVDWWTAEPTSRDYWRLWLSSPEGGLEALIFVDRVTGRRYLQAVGD